MRLRARFRAATRSPATPLTERDRIQALTSTIDDLPDPERQSAIRQRCVEVILTLTGHAYPATGTADLVRALGEALTPLDPARAWLMLAVLDGRYPESPRVHTATRAATLDGTMPVLLGVLEDLTAAACRPPDQPGTSRPESWRQVQVLADQTLVDVHHTATAGFATGIQRVTREVTRRWFQDHQVTLVGWHQDLSGLRLLTPDESHRARYGGPEVEVPTDDPLVVPWNCRYILPELAAEPQRATCLQTFGEFSSNRVSIIGHDVVPVTTAEVSQEAMGRGFALYLAAARYADVIAPVSEGSAVEYRGWRAMLAGAGLTGPRIEPVTLPAEAPPQTQQSMRRARSRIPVGSLPAVLVVGSHEPRKNHLAILHAAELLWREGRQFSLCFIGGNSWNSEEFTRNLEDLRAAGRPVEALLAADDDLLWGAYRVARFTVFPSLNEGFGLPVAESLACGTPVITSGFGSMKQIAEDGGGALLIDPRDDRSLTDAMRALLVDDDLLEELRRQARNRPARTWDTYAEQTWAMLHDPVHEPSPELGRAPRSSAARPHQPVSQTEWTADAARPTPKEPTMEQSVSHDLHAARVLLSEQNVVDTRRFGLAKRFVMRGSRMFTHRLVAASEHLAMAVQAADEGGRVAVSEVRGELAVARDETRRMQESLNGLAGEVETHAVHRQQQLVAELGAVSERLLAATAAVATLEGAVRSLRSRLTIAERAVAHQRSELQRARTQVTRLSRTAPPAGDARDAAPVEWSADALDEQGYLDFEERFRGSRDEIRARQRDAVRFVKDLQTGRGALLDIACGRGEWLDVLRSEGIEAYGVDTNTVMIADAAANGLDVRHEDALVHLAKLEESSLQGISAFHFVEHIPLGVLVGMLDDSLLALRPGGILLLETPNPTNFVVGSASFYLDPTHLRPIHPEFLRFLVESRGFTDVQIHYVHPAVPADTMIGSGPPEGYPDERLNRVVTAIEAFVYGPQDYVLTARRAQVAEPESLVVPTEG